VGDEEFTEADGCVDEEVAIQRIRGNRMSIAKRTITHEGTFNRYLLWKEYEKIAMHFNSLIIKLRSQSLGGVAVFATLTAVITRADTTPKVRWGLLTGAFALLSIFWIAVWILDIGYYNRLLAGAVQALLDIEKESSRSALVGEINLSTKINDHLKLRTSKGLGHNISVRAFYAIVLAGLLVAMSFCLGEFYSAMH
jgi:hypothetical protein